MEKIALAAGVGSGVAVLIWSVARYFFIAYFDALKDRMKESRENETKIFNRLETLEKDFAALKSAHETIHSQNNHDEKL